MHQGTEERKRGLAAMWMETWGASEIFRSYNL